jgi:hypothetical protein
MRSALGVAIMVVVTITGCSDDTPTYAEQADAAEQVAVAIAGSDIGLAAVARPSSCVPPSSCPDIAVVELPDRTTLAIESLADIARESGWEATVVDGRLITIEDRDDDRSGSISLDSEGRVVVAVG